MIADSTEDGKDQVISGTITYPWEGCKVDDDIIARNERTIAEALSFAKERGYFNIREVIKTYKEIYINKWRMVDWKQCGREKIIPYKA